MDDELGIQFEIFPKDALERYHLEGKLRVVGQDVLLHYKNRERTFTREQNKLVTIELELADTPFSINYIETPIISRH